MPTGDIQITIVDNGVAVVVPNNAVQVVIATANSGPVATPVATQSAKTLQSVFGGGQLVEAGGLSALAGGTIIALRAATVTDAASSSVTMSRVGSSTATVSVSGTPNDEYYVAVKVTKGGAIGTAGITLRISLDAGRNYGPTLALGTTTTLPITGTGLTLGFASSTQTLDTGDMAFFGTTPALWDTGAVTDCLNALGASPYAVTGFGSTHIAGPASGAQCDTIQTILNSMESKFLYTRAIMDCADASPATKWGGSGQTEVAWMSSVETSFSASSDKRVVACAGNYNMPSAFGTTNAGTPRYRRNLGWALAARQVQIPPQRHAGRVKDGALSNIIIDPILDPTDGFVYHDERINPGFTAARLCAARSRLGLPGYYIDQPNLLSPTGSVFTILPLGNVMDRACGIVHQVGQQELNTDVRLNDNGTLYETEAQRIEHTLFNALKAFMINTSQISNAFVVVDRTQNVLATGIVKVSVTIVSRGYVLEEDVDIMFSNPFAA
jgi:hypothetical protein